MIKILFVCHGNICRSPMAEYVMKDLVAKAGLADQFVIDSAATHNDEIGSTPHPGTRRILEKHNIHCGDHKARRLKSSDALDWDLLIGMDRANLRNMQRQLGSAASSKLYTLLEFAGRDADIADPWYTGNFDETFRDVCDGCTGLLNFLKGRLR